MRTPYRLTLRPMDFGEILDNTFQVYRASFADLFIIGLISALPNMISTGVTSSISAALGPAKLVTSGMQLITTLIFSVVSLLFLPLVEGGTVAVVANSAMGEPADWRAALTAAGRRYGRMFGISVILAIGGIIAVVVLAIAGLGIFAVITIPVGLLTLAVYVGFSNQAVMVEDEPSSFSAIYRSFLLVSGRFWPLLGLLIVLGLLAWVVNLGVNYLVTLPFDFLGAGSGPTVVWLQAIFKGIGSALTWPLVLIGRTIAYFDTRIRKEGFDLEMLARTQLTGGQPPL